MYKTGMNAHTCPQNILNRGSDTTVTMSAGCFWPFWLSQVCISVCLGLLWAATPSRCWAGGRRTVFPTGSVPTPGTLTGAITVRRSILLIQQCHVTSYPLCTGLPGSQRTDYEWRIKLVYLCLIHLVCFEICCNICLQGSLKSCVGQITVVLSRRLWQGFQSRTWGKMSASVWGTRRFSATVVLKHSEEISTECVEIVSFVGSFSCAGFELHWSLYTDWRWIHSADLLHTPCMQI